MAELVSSAHARCFLAFESLIKALQQSDHDFDDQIELTEIQNGFDKYTIWAGNVGAAHSGKRFKISLDYRLREASFLKEQVLRLLATLQGRLLTAAELVRGDHELPEEHSEETDSEISTSDIETTSQHDEEASEDSSWEISSDDSSDEGVSSKLNRKTVQRANEAQIPPTRSNRLTSQMSRLVESIETTIAYLYRLPLRKPAPLDRIKNRSFLDSASYQHFDVLYVKDKFPNLQPQAAIRLGKMITRRRQILYYREAHNQSLEVTRVKPEVATESHDLSSTSIYESGPKITVEDRGSQLASSQAASSHFTLHTKATTVRSGDLKLFVSQEKLNDFFAPSVAESKSSMASSYAGKDLRVQIPPRPTDENGQELEQFECPYCLLVTYITTGQKWKKHVLEDLQPYVCTYGDCELYDHFFDSRDTWFRHETQYHRTKWSCNIDGHPEYDSEEDFLAHMRADHNRRLDEANFNLVKNQFQKPTKSDRGMCNLCHRHSKNLRSHVSRHLQQLAIFALPRANHTSGSGHAERDSESSRYKKDDSDESGSSKSSSANTDELADQQSVLKDLEFGAADVENDFDEGDPIPDDVEGQEWDNVTDKFSKARQGAFRDLRIMMHMMTDGVERQMTLMFGRMHIKSLYTDDEAWMEDLQEMDVIILGDASGLAELNANLNHIRTRAHVPVIIVHQSITNVDVLRNDGLVKYCFTNFGQSDIEDALGKLCQWAPAPPHWRPASPGRVVSDIAPAAAAAEEILPTILQQLESFEDLFNCASINRGFYRVFKRNELDLMKRTLWNMSPPAWEYYEICYLTNLPGEDNNAAAYFKRYEQDMMAFAQIKELIKHESSNPPDIADAFDSEDPEARRRVDDALWRIQTFCKLFAWRKNGPRISNEQDMTVQIDWLQGGILANLSKSASANDKSVTELLTGTPTCFAKGNVDLTSEKLLDILDLWLAINKILPLIDDKTIQAWSDERDPDFQSPNKRPEKWRFWLLTHGFTTILKAHELWNRSEFSILEVMSENDLEDWSPSASVKALNNFLQLAISYAHEDRIKAASPDDPVRFGNALRVASFEGREWAVKQFLILGADVNFISSHDQYYCGALLAASCQGHSNVVRLLLDKGADTTVTDEAGRTPLHLACRHGSFVVVRLLLEHGVDVRKVQNDGWTCLHYSAENGSSTNVRLLIEAGADVNAITNEGWAPLHFAAYNSHFDASGVLIDAGADVKAMTHQGSTPLQLAVEGGAIGECILFLEAGADVDSTTHSDLTPLNYAANNGDKDIVELLLDHRANVEIATDKGWTPLITAAAKGHLDIVKLLIAAGADLTVANHYERAALHLAALNGHIDLAKFLFRCDGVEINIPDPVCGTFLNLLAFLGHTDLLRMAYEQCNANKNLREPQKRTPLHLAARGGHLDTFQYLMDLGFHPIFEDEKGDTVLAYACLGGSVEIVDILLEHYSLLNVAPQRWTPLHWACKAGHREIVKRLINAGHTNEQFIIPGYYESWSPPRIAFFHGHGAMLDDVSHWSHGAGRPHPNHTCDGCNYTIYGTRYNCKACSDFDYCFMCYPLLKHLHKDHKWELVEPT